MSDKHELFEHWLSCAKDAAGELYSRNFTREECEEIFSRTATGKKLLGRKKSFSEFKQEEETRKLEGLEELLTKVKKADANLANLSYDELQVLIDNFQTYPSVKRELHRSECLVREALYKVALFDRNLQAGLQTQEARRQTAHAKLQNALLKKIAYGGSDVGSSEGSTLARNAALQKLIKIEENTGDVSEGLGFD